MANTVTLCVAEGRHERLRSDPDAWAAGVKPIGEQEIDVGVYAPMGNCVVCDSTLIFNPSTEDTDASAAPRAAATRAA